MDVYRPPNNDKELASHDCPSDDTVRYTLTLSNKGPDGATGAQVTDKLPTGISYVSDDSGVLADGNKAYNPASGILAVGDVPANSHKTLEITVKVD